MVKPEMGRDQRYVGFASESLAHMLKSIRVSGFDDGASYSHGQPLPPHARRMGSHAVPVTTHRVTSLKRSWRPRRSMVLRMMVDMARPTADDDEGQGS